ncbi:DUF2779 domain-containing protein [Mycoplasma testudineum]|nr:DUF2779 domain-containing protein [Mycoplasma testudineum]OYD27085.1 hypothetical protein CG473_00320 [Mycoplasma testudineum]
MKDGTLHSSIKYDNEIYKLVSLIEKPIYIYNEIIRRKSISKLVIDKYDLESRLYNKFSDVPFKSDLLTYFYPDAKKYNQVKFKLHKLASEAEWINLKKYIEKLEKELKVVDQELTKTEIDKYLIKDIKYIWYDFETISFPFCAIDNFVPYTKIPFQVSIIRTMNSTQLQGEDEAENLIIDPINIDLEQIAKFIDRIYSFADLQNNLPARYITYNKAFENSVLRSIVNIMEMSNFLNYEIYQKKVEQIIDNTLDLNDFFKESKSLILIGELYWKSSIKLVEKFITKHNYPFKNMIIPYSSLDIQNGLVAMEAGIKRYMGNITDEVWKSDYEKNLKTYCENDVKAMLMVFELIKDIFKNQYPELGNFSNPY